MKITPQDHLFALVHAFQFGGGDPCPILFRAQCGDFRTGPNRITDKAGFKKAELVDPIEGFNNRRVEWDQRIDDGEDQ